VLDSCTFLLVVVNHALDILVGGCGSRGFLLSPAVQALSLEQVEVKREHPSDNEANQGDKEGLLGADVVGDCAEDRGEQSTARYGGDDETGTTLGVTAETSDRESEDQGEHARLEE